ncbi:beta strand repeat-containing protein [Thiofilum flexile]|uniref:beta strand repeat-containing protein n=1 Tax=Thiofilum flexile TaxID=125627 RepID=UPI0003A27993|nr:GEVED domain-containing protein [Thiofilum flexile]
MNIIHLLIALFLPKIPPLPSCLFHSGANIRRSLGVICLFLGTALAAPVYAADDLSDAPASYGAPSHTIAGTLKLGANAPDGDTTLSPLDGSGDDVTGTDDEDGISSFPTLYTGVTAYSIPLNRISATGTGTLHAWIDFNKDGVFSASEYKSVAVSAGVLADSLNWNSITAGSVGTTYARFRFTSTALTDNAATTTVDERSTMAAANGEVEDYAIAIEAIPPLPAFCATETLIDNGNFSSGTLASTTWTVPNNSGWIYANAPYDIPILAAYSYTSIHYNSDQSGGLYDAFNPSGNPSTGMYNILQESDGPSTAVAYHFPRALKPGVYPFSFDLTSRFNHTVFQDQYKVSLYNADTDTITAVLAQDFVDTLPTAAVETPQWKTISGSVSVPIYGNYYLLFQVDQNLAGQNSDYMIDRVIFAGAVCPTLDRADAPSSYGTPVHFLPSTLHLGVNVDSDDDTFSVLDGSGDGADDDGVTTFPWLIAGTTSYTIPAASISATGTGTLYAWVDFNKDGLFAANEERSVAVTNGVLAGPLSWTGIAVGSVGTTYARLRFTSAALTDNATTTTVDERSTMSALDGEIEDYALAIETLLDRSDAPASYGAPTHAIAGTLKLGANAPDSEGTLTPLNGSGDDVTGTDDEDGVSAFPTLLVGATSYTLPIANISATGTGTLHAWIDFDKNGAFTSSEYRSVAVTTGTLAGALTWSSISAGSAGTTYARFRFTSTVLTDNAATTTVDERATMAAANGEVEDYAFPITEPPTDYSDAPASYGTATHTIVAGTQLGATITADTSALQDADNASDDGVLLAPLTSGASSYTLNAASITATGSGNLYVWIDFNGNGVFETTEFASTTVATNVVAGNLTFTGFGSITASGSTYARVRFTSNTLTSADASTATTNGEVEDYAVSVAAPLAYPTDPNTATCPMDSSSTFTATTEISWNHGIATDRLAPNILSAEIASATNITAGSGIIYTTSTATGRIIGADHSGYLAAYQAGDYAQYEFTTASSLNAGRFLKQIRYGVTPSSDPNLPYQVSILFSTDPSFANATLIVDSQTVVTPAVYTQTVVPTLEPVYIQPSTTYYMRVIFHDVTSSTGDIHWDDFVTFFSDCRDYGDAPTSATSYGAPYHAITEGGSTLRLGASVEAEGAAWSSTDADGDNTHGLNDEDGVSAFVPLNGSTSSYTLPAANITAQGSGTLYAWVDFNANGTFESTEFASTTVTSNVLAGDLVFSGFGAIAASGTTYARLRLTTDTLTNADATLAANNGEVEDYALAITPNTAPVITSDGGGATAALAVDENQTAVTTVTATDADSDVLTYSITGGADAALFTIDATTGVLTFITAPDFESPTDADSNNVYEVQVTVDDSRGGTTVQDLAITVTDVAENVAPVINSDGGGATAALSVDENQTAVTTVTATDANPTDTLTYTISGGADAALFAIDASTGVLTFITAPDFESPTDADMNNTYLVQVTVDDGNGGTDIQDLTITVANVDEDLKLTVMGWLQGPYDANSGLMVDSLRSRDLLPSTQPYGQYPAFNYTGTEMVSAARLAITGTNAVVDWVLVELRDALDPTIIITRKAALLTREGNVLNADTDSPQLTFSLSAGSYYVVLRHRNHLAVMTQTPIPLSAASAAVVDFRLTATLTYGTQARMESGAQALLWAGNSNLDQNVIAYGANNDINPILGSVLMAVDNTLLNSNYILPGYANADVNLSGDVIYAGVNNDVNILVGNVLLHPNNTTYSANFVVTGTVPASP